jgi:hypothetical protein
MTQCLIKHNKKKGDSAFTMVELLMAVAFSVLLLTGVYGFYNAASQSYNSGISGQTLQDAADIVLSQIIEGESESGVVHRLSTANSYMIPNGSANYLYSCGGAPQAAPCNANNPSGEIYYCFNAQTADSPCVGAGDTNARWYYLNSAGTAIIYHHPAAGGGTVEQKIYTAPKGSTLILRFVPAAVNTPLNVVEIDVALTQNLWPGIANSRLATGAASTFVILRNHP